MAFRDWFSIVAKPSLAEPSVFTEIGKAFVGDFREAARTLGLTDSVFSLVATFNTMSISGATNREKTFDNANFALGIANGVAILPDAAAESRRLEHDCRCLQPHRSY